MARATIIYIITHAFLFYVTIITFNISTGSHLSLVTYLCSTSRHRYYPLVSLTNDLTLPSSIPAPLVPSLSAMDAKTSAYSLM